jgi:hypothetical protein
LIFFYQPARRAAGEQLRLDGLPKRDPESVEIMNNELSHAVEGII